MNISQLLLSDKGSQLFALFTSEMYLRDHNKTQSLEEQPGTSEEVFEREIGVEIFDQIVSEPF